MSSTNTTSAPTSGSPDQKSGVAVSPDQILDQMEKQLEQLKGLRRKQGLISLFGILAILLVLIIFIVKIFGFVQNFDQTALSAALVQRAALMAKSNEVGILKEDFRKVFIPALQEALTKQVTTRSGELSQKMDDEAQKILNYVRTDVKDRVSTRLHDSLVKVEKQLIAKYSKKVPSEKELANSVREFEAIFLADVTSTMNQNLTRAQKELAGLYDMCQSFKTLPEYKIIQSMEQDEAEAAIVETFLELWIYHINPYRSMQKADINGGI